MRRAAWPSEPWELLRINTDLRPTRCTWSAKSPPDVVVAGPAFGAGRYGLACARVCAEVTARLGRPALTGMHPDNAALAVHRDQIIVPTAPSASA